MVIIQYIRRSGYHTGSKSGEDYVIAELQTPLNVKHIS